MKKLALPISLCLAFVLGTLALSAAEVPSAAPAAAPAAVQEAAAITPILLSPQPLPAFMLPADTGAGCAASLLSMPKTLNFTGCGECTKRSQCPACDPGCVKDCDGFGCCVCYCP